jgi:hypothetical protein
MSRFLIALALMGLVGSAAGAQTIEFVGDGVVIDIDDNVGVGNLILPGDPLAFAYTFDAATGDSDPDPGFGEYLGAPVESGVGLAIAAEEILTFACDELDIFVWNDSFDLGGSLQDAYFATPTRCSPFEPSLVVSSIDVLLTDSSQTALASDALPVEPPDVVNDWELASVFLDLCPSTNPGCNPAMEGVSVLGLIDVIEVPEPGAVLLHVTGLGGIFGLAGLRGRRFRPGWERLPERGRS